MSKRLAPLAILVLFAWTVVAQSRPEVTFSRTLKVTGPLELDVQTGAGNVSVRPGSAGSVQITGKVRAGNESDQSTVDRVKTIAANPPIEQNGNSIRIGPRETNHSQYEHISISYDIVVPPETRLNSSTGSGSQKIEGIRGPLRVNAGSGNLSITDVDQDVTAHTGSGNIDLDGLAGSVEAQAGSGNILGRHLGRAVSKTATPPNGNTFTAQSAASAPRLLLQTGSGGVRLEDAIGALRVQTGSGAIQVSGEPEADWNLETGSGGVRLTLPHDFSCELYARTGSGSITVDQPVTVQGTLNRHELRAKMGGGGPSLNVRTGSGSIHVQ